MSIGLKTDLIGGLLLYYGSNPPSVWGSGQEGPVMGKYSSGIGLTEAIAMMGAVEAMHSCRCELRITTAGQAHNGGARIELEATFDVLPGSELPKVLLVSHTWPTRTAGTFEGLFYNLCWQLDYAIQKAYEQMEQPKEA